MTRKGCLVSIAMLLFSFASAFSNADVPVEKLKDALFAYKAVSSFWKAGQKLLKGASVADGEVLAMNEDGMIALDDELKRVQNHWPSPATPRPDVSADRTFSLDEKTRESARKDLEAYLDSNKRSIERLQHKREELSAARIKWDDLYQDLRDVEQRLTAVMADPKVTAFTEYKLGYAWKELYVDLMPTVSSLGDGYKGLVQKYNKIIAQNTKGQADISALLSTVKIIHGVTSFPDDARNDASRDSHGPTKSIGDRIKASTSSASSATRTDIAATRERVDAMRARNEALLRQYDEQGRSARSATMPNDRSSPPTFEGSIQILNGEEPPRGNKGK